MVETTLDEVEERLEFVKGKSANTLKETLKNPESVFLLGNPSSPYAAEKIGLRNSFFKSSSLRSSALESLSTRADHEVLMDFFWTLYSKLIAVVEGFRLVTEVSNRICSVYWVSPSDLFVIDARFSGVIIKIYL